MLSEEDLIINKFAQDKIDLDEASDWFGKHQNPKQVLALLRFYIEQAHPNDDIINQTISNVPIKQTMTPVVILKTSKQLSTALEAIVGLPSNEYLKSFILMMWLFKMADTARRITYCKNGCDHKWHNLRD